jgi:hypothetical protein
MVKIIVEGEQDKNFIEILIKEHFKSPQIYGVEQIGGYTKINNYKPKLQEYKDFNYQTLIIFDADYASTNGGYQTRLKYLTEFRDNNNFDYDVFLFPNNSDDGDFECLLESIINKKHQCLINCFTQYEKCINQCVNNQNERKYKSPLRKSKIYAYLDAFKKSKKKEEEFKKHNYFFKNKEYWNLKSEYLAPLIKFLKRYF